MFLITSVHGAGRSRMRMLGQLGRWTTLLASLACSLGISSWLYLSHSSSSFDREVPTGSGPWRRVDTTTSFHVNKKRKMPLIGVLRREGVLVENRKKAASREPLIVETLVIPKECVSVVRSTFGSIVS
ncbi:hypothetical protein V6N12_068653 [Hibiscus sabdariffa]|uniref:Uncharacterized protein n=1 Tax=Hibiscus sabdariffa TaxID=183260 RepID=A0ABR2FQM2_9ROSI